jgi:hypothetical protein
MRVHLPLAAAAAGVAGLIAACSADDLAVEPTAGAAPRLALAGVATGGGPFQFTPLDASAACTSGGDAVNPLVLPAGYAQAAVASEPQFGDAIDMNTQNESGPQTGRYLYRAHENGSNASVSVTDLVTGATRTIAQRADWESLDPTVWTPWGTLLIGEETNAAARRDPGVPQAVGGLVYELVLDRADPTVVTAILPRPAIGAKSHEGMRFDTQGNLYSISERTPGYIFKFVPDTKGDLSSGQTYVLKVTQPDGDRTGAAEWVPLDRAAVQVDASAAADAVGATGYGRPEDVEIATSTGGDRGGANTLYVAITSEHRVLAIELREPAGGSAHATAFVSDYVSRGVNATGEFTMPDNLALDRAGNLYITEDPGGSFSSGKRQGDDIWVAAPNRGARGPASSVARFASLTDCDAEPTGIYFETTGGRLFVNVQHRGGDRLDKAMAVYRPQGAR